MIYNSYQIADIVGVNVSTIKRWTDSGKLNCYQTIGRHRKFHLNDLVKFLKENKKTATDINLKHLVGNNNSLIEAINNSNTEFLIKHSYQNLIKGNSENFLAINNSLILKGFPIYFIFDKIIIEVLKKIGEEWSKGKLTITEEHLASEIIRKFLSNINFQHIPNKTKFNAFCFTLVNDKHDIPIHMGEAIINQNKNIKTFNLGQNLPINDFVKISQKINPNIIFISIIYIENVDLINKQINQLCKQFYKTNTHIIFRGTGSKNIKTKFKNYTHIDTFENFNSYITKHFQ